MDPRTLPQTAIVDIGEADVDRVGLTGWRVTDSLLAVGDHRHLLGFIEARADHFEAMQIGAVFTWTLFDTMESAVRHLLTAGRLSAVARETSPMSWIGGIVSDPSTAG